MMTFDSQETTFNRVRAADQVPPPPQSMPMPAPYGKRSYKPGLRYRKRGRFLHYPEEKSGLALFPSSGYSAVALGRC